MKLLRELAINPNAKTKRRYAEYLCECGNKCIKPADTKTTTCGNCRREKFILRITNVERKRREKNYAKRMQKLEVHIEQSVQKCILRDDPNYDKQIELDCGDEIRELQSERSFLDLPHTFERKTT